MKKILLLLPLAFMLVGCGSLGNTAAVKGFGLVVDKIEGPVLKDAQVTLEYAKTLKAPDDELASRCPKAVLRLHELKQAMLDQKAPEGAGVMYALTVKQFGPDLKKNVVAAAKDVYSSCSGLLPAELLIGQ